MKYIVQEALEHLALLERTAECSVAQAVKDLLNASPQQEIVEERKHRAIHTTVFATRVNTAFSILESAVEEAEEENIL